MRRLRLPRGAAPLLLLVLLMLLAACKGGSPVQEDSVHIRIQNNMGQEIENFWLGRGGNGPAAVPYGPIPLGALTEYQRFPAELPYYSALNFLTVDGQRYLDNVYETTGDEGLTPGYYTFVYTRAGDRARLAIVRDQ